MSTEYGKERILNPPNKTPILKVPWRPALYCEKIDNRVCLYVENYLKSEDVKKRFDKIKNETVSFFKKVSSEVYAMESDWTDVLNDENEATVPEADFEISTGSFVGVVVATSPIWVPLVAAGVGLAVAFAGVTIALSPVLIPLNAYLGREDRKKKLIDKQYENCKSTVRSMVCNQLESNVGTVLSKFIDKVTIIVLPRRIDGLQHMSEFLLKSRSHILAKQGLLLNLETKIKEIEEDIKAIQK